VVVRRSRPRVDLLLAATGIVLMSTGVAWLLLMAELSGGDANATVGVLLLIVAAGLAARWLTRYHGWIAPLLVVAGAAYLAIAHFDILLGRPLRSPLGYSNATGSFYMLAAAAALLIVARASSPLLRIAAVAAAVAAASVPWLNQTTTATVLVCLLPLALLTRTLAAVRMAVSSAAGAVLLSLLVVIALGISYNPVVRSGVVDRAVDATLSERRPQLWHDALVLVAERPLTGVGPNRFPEESATARSDRDTIWPHNEALHFGAEAGIPGMLFLLGLFGWGFARLWWGAGDAGAAVAALALGAVGVHANVDYVLHYPAVGMAAAALVGAGSLLPAGHPSRPRNPPSTRARARDEDDPPEWDLSFLDEPVTGWRRHGSFRR
jgi:hypothetical protein